MSNLISSWLSSGKQLNDDEYRQIDNYVRKILDANYEAVMTDNMEEAPF
jgi:mono/diheme cytochrome c family protein